MPLATTVNLPKRHKARFPDKCVVCGCESPASTVRLMTGSIGWWSWLLFVFGKPFAVKAPACRLCGWRLHLLRFGSIFLMIGIAWAAWAFIFPMFEDHVPRAARKWVMLGLAMLCIVPQAIFEAFFPHPFNLTAYAETVDYEFRDPELAVEFAMQNWDAEHVKIGDNKIN